MKQDKYCIFCISIMQTLKKFTIILSSHYNHGKDPKTFCLNFDCPKMLMIIWSMNLLYKSNESLAEKTKIEQWMLKYKHGNNIHEHGKQKNESVT